MTEAPTSIYDFEALSIEGRPAHLDTQRGKVLLIVNTEIGRASCRERV